MNYWGAAIPGLAMTAKELPSIDGLLRLENPEIGTAAALSKAYSLEELARLHLDEIRKNFSADTPCTIIGFSLGAMVVSILASEYRSELPPSSRFRFLAPSANGSSTEAAPDSLIDAWKDALPGEQEVFRVLLADFFSEKYKDKHPLEFETYVSYRATGGNAQSARAFRRQTAALRAFQGEKYFPRLDPKECVFVRGAVDRIFPAKHLDEIIRMLPDAEVREIEGAGHMLHLEAPWLFARDIPDD